ncbi:MAG: 4Fe-4S dicluster domain-containing protein [Pseudomonadota bacterium]
MPKLPPVPAIEPSFDQLAHWPAGISGNTLNGVGEATPRRPTPVLWHDPDRLAHGELQNWFWRQGSRIPEMAARREARQRIIDAEPGALAARANPGTPKENHAAVHAVARAAGAELVGCVPLDPEWVFSGYEFDHPWLVVLGVVMDHDRLIKAPAVEAGLEVVDQYTRGWHVARPVADWIRSRGHAAEAHGGPMAGPVNLLPAALASGFGELGKHGSIINREYGSSFRLSMVATDLPLLVDEPDEFGADDCCEGCQVCVDACPVDAISNLKQLVRGAEKWYVDFDRCFRYFAETFGCAVCIARCPWSYPDRAPVLAERWTRRRR